MSSGTLSLVTGTTGLKYPGVIVALIIASAGWLASFIQVAGFVGQALQGCSEGKYIFEEILFGSEAEETLLLHPDRCIEKVVLSNATGH